MFRQRYLFFSLFTQSISEGGLLPWVSISKVNYQAFMQHFYCQSYSYSKELVSKNEQKEATD